MWWPTWTALYFTLLITIHSNGLDINSLKAEVIKFHFSELNGALLYFCTTKDAKFVLKKLSQENYAFNGKVLDNVISNHDLEITLMQPQVLGVFLDLNCNNGLNFLQQCSDMFNGSYRWLLWSDDYKNAVKLLKPMRVSADSDVSVARPVGDTLMVTNLYRMHVTQKFKVTNTTQWLENQVIKLQHPPPRESFEGVRMAASLMMTEIKFNESNLLDPLLDRSYENDIDGISRYGLAVFLHLSEMCRFSYSFLLSNDWGKQLPNGSWSGMIGQLQSRQTEIGLSPFKYQVQATKVIDYVTSIITVRPCFTFLQPRMFGNQKALIRPLDLSVWLCLLIITLAALIMFRIIAFYEGDTVHNDSWGGSALIVVAAISQQGLPDSTDKVSTRLIYLSLVIVSFFAVTYYNTAILNGLLLQAPNSIHNIDQLVQSDLKLGVVDKPLLHEELEKNDSLIQEVLQKIWLSNAPNESVYSIKNGVRKIKEEQFALFTRDEDIYTQLLDQLTDAEICLVSEVEIFNPHHAGAVTANNSPYKEIFNRKFNLMKERGVLDRQWRYWQEPKPECHWRQDPSILSTGPLSMAFIVMIVGPIAAVLVFILEIIFYNITISKTTVKVKPFEKIQ